MTSEHLLDAMGLLDDDLIQDAEVVTQSRSQIIWNQFRRWAPTAACVALLLIAVQFLPLRRDSSSESTDAASPSVGADASYSHIAGDQESSTNSSVSPSMGQSSEEENLYHDSVSVTIDGLTYVYLRQYTDTPENGPRVETLPDGCQNVGVVEQIHEDITVPHTDTGIYIGCSLWLEGEGEESTLYLELPEGGYLVFDYSQTHDFSPGGRG